MAVQFMLATRTSEAALSTLWSCHLWPHVLGEEKSWTVKRLPASGVFGPMVGKDPGPNHGRAKSNVRVFWERLAESVSVIIYRRTFTISRNSGRHIPKRN